MKLRPSGWALPRPKAIHHMVEDFLAEWDSPISHIQPLRRFLEHCVQTDLRAFYAGKAVCFVLQILFLKYEFHTNFCIINIKKCITQMGHFCDT